jgi:NAD(P)-dependent dehydrogenase (short-subunit alcohol dehydrogenase family)
MNLELANKLALVSGSTAGIGFAIAELLLREGARVIINGRTQQGVDAALAKLSAHGGAALGFAGDLSQAEAAGALAREHPNVEILVNNNVECQGTPGAVHSMHLLRWVAEFPQRSRSGYGQH